MDGAENDVLAFASLEPLVTEWVTGGGGGGITLKQVQDDLGNTSLVAGTGITKTHNDGANTIPLAVTSGTYRPLDADLTALAAAGNSDTLAATTATFTTTKDAKLASIAEGAQVNNTASVNGQTGTVVLDYEDVGAPEADHTHVMEEVVEQLSTYSLPGELATWGGSIPIVFPFAVTIESVRTAVGTAPTGASVIVDVNKNGTTIFMTQGDRPTIAAAGTVSDVEVPAVTAVASGDKLTVDADQVGSTLPGEDLVVVIAWTAT